MQGTYEGAARLRKRERFLSPTIAPRLVHHNFNEKTAAPTLEEKNPITFVEVSV